MIMGVVAATAVLCGAASAAPPALSEGREQDPVARDFFLGGSPTPDAAPRGVPAPASGAPGTSFLANVREVLLSRFTVPLGTVRPASGVR
jgi:hypothetical protein